MTFWQALLVTAAGVAAGTINSVVGSGTLITFPVLLALGYSPVTANVSNSVGLVPGSVAGAIGYREELRGQRGRALRLGVCSLTGSIAGAVGLLLLPARAFKAIVPVFIVVALVLIVVQPRLSAWLAARRDHQPHGGRSAATGVFATGVYGGYFGAAQGILLISLLALTLPEPLQRVNALKNVLAAITNATAGVVFVIAAHVAWLPAVLIAGGSAVGGVAGGRYGRRLPPRALRALIVVVGVVAIVRLR